MRAGPARGGVLTWTGGGHVGTAKWVRDDSVEATRRRLAHLLAIGAVRAATRRPEVPPGPAAGEVPPEKEVSVVVSDTI